jgi:hypothetical protein
MAAASTSWAVDAVMPKRSSWGRTESRAAWISLIRSSLSEGVVSECLSLVAGAIGDGPTTLVVALVGDLMASSPVRWIATSTRT